MIGLAALLIVLFLLAFGLFGILFLPLAFKSLPKDAAERDARKVKADDH